APAMLITLCYLYLWARWGPRSAALVRSTVRRLHRSRCSFTFCARQPQPEERVCVRVGGKVFCTGEAQFLDDLNRWSVLLVSPFIHPEKLLAAEHIAFVTESISAQAENVQGGPDSSKEIVKWSDFCSPLAYKPGEPFKLIAEASVDNFSSLGIAFLEDRLQMDNGMVPHRIVSVHLEESALKELTKEKEVKEKSADMDAVTPAGKSGSGRGEEEKCKKKEEEEEREQEETGAGEHHHLHLSSCHECLQLESSTIESVKFASAENIAQLPDDCSSRREEKEDECLEKGVKRINLTGKPPNILIYLGSEAAKARFEQVKAVLRECVDAESYTMYLLQQEQLLRDPWLENCLLLVIATEEPIPEGSHKQFMTFLSKGGKILGFSSSFTFGGVQIKQKNKLRKAVRELVVSKKDSTEVKLSLLVSGCVFEEGMKGDSSRVKVLSRLNNADKDTVIVHLAHGSSGGEAILCQAHLELDSNSMDVQTEEDFNLLKMSNSKRYEILKDFLTCLGLSCELSEIPALTPIYLLSPDEKYFLINVKLTDEYFNCEKMSSSLVTNLLGWDGKFNSYFEKEGSIFSLGNVHLKSVIGRKTPQFYGLRMKENRIKLDFRKEFVAADKHVGFLVFSLIGRLMFELPEEMGLIAVAARQTQGKGRGGNVWLSPLGCALCTLHISIPLHSNLGQRIPFIQHLVSLAVVEAVRSIPGYEVWIIVWNSELNAACAGNKEFVSLVVSFSLSSPGFGFNVNNSNPTICINDLIAKFNREEGTELKPLSVDCLIARTVTVLERLIEIFQEKGPNGVLPQYYKYWVH
ncbi:BPL1 ligase, partial [Cercotrichas coryphoeus]|nr:BPL1 ligase [Cercotrichas coryphoeus]